MKEIMFNFTLDPVESIQPWGEPGAHSLHWLALSLGQYYLQIGTAQVLQYSPAVLEYFRTTDPMTPYYPYVDHQVAQLHEDLIDMLPCILQPVPSDVAQILREHTLRGVWDRLVEDNAMNFDKDYNDALRWLYERRLDLWHLTQSPLICFWREYDRIVIEWEGSGHFDGIPAWAFPQGRQEVSVNEFVAAVREFHEQFVAEMGERVRRFEDGWSIPNVAVDVVHLRTEQERRQRLFDTVLQKEHCDSDWEQARHYLRKAGFRL